MKRSLLIFTVFLIAISCNKKESKIASKTEYATFGEKITKENTITKEILLEKYKTFKKGDTLAVKVSSKINEICQNKGCWMTLDLGSEKTAFVKFKD
ncbi:MAG: DUF4920 domain-containing protein, partial [Flavobacteriales bacterium]